jgi:biopolymer transport protein ExbD
MLYDFEDKPELNITPLVDVMLVLLAILMVIAPNIIYEEQIKLPQGSMSQQLSKIPPVHISIDKEQNVKINKDNYQLHEFMDNFFFILKN